MLEEQFSREFLEGVNRGLVTSKRQVDRFKKQLSYKYRLARLPTNPDIMKYATDEQISKFADIMNIKPTRSISGVAIITVSCKPGPCGGACTYCLPATKITPRSYSPLETAIQRAIRNQFDPSRQVRDRLNQYRIMAHPTDKIEVIVIGGTFLALEKDYQESFVKGIYGGLNGFESDSLEEAQRVNETAKHRCVNLTFETRPDYCLEPHIDSMLHFGVTRIEIGVQSVYDDVLLAVDRGHTVADAIKAIKLSRDAAFKINLHIMPNLPGSDLDRDLEMFRILFENPNFRPDYMKIYPTLVMPNTILYEQWKEGKFRPYTIEELVELMAKAKEFIPKYCRIQRLGRDMPSTEIAAGYKESNIRELVQHRAKQLGIECQCIRCREVGFKVKEGIRPKDVKLCRMDYEASNGDEVFLSFEDVKNNVIFGFLRLRIPNESHRQEIDKKSALVRELRVMGFSVPIDENPEEYQWQHRGFGKQLMLEGERIAAEEFDRNKVVVVSAVGTREYYRKIGYFRDGVYMSKKL